MLLKKCLMSAAGAAILLFSAFSYAGPGWASGKVVTEAGRPVSGATVHLYGINMNGGRVGQNARTKADGSYRIKVPYGLYQEGSAEIYVDYHGQHYQIGIPAENQGAQFDSSVEEVKMDFVWRASGVRNRGMLESNFGYFGFSGGVYFGTGKTYTRDFLNAMENFELIFTPDSPLMNGDPSKKFTVIGSEPGRNAHSDYFFWCFYYDVPAGHYNLTANVIMNDGSRVPAMVQLDGQKPQLSVSVQPKGGLPFPFIELHLAPTAGILKDEPSQTGTYRQDWGSQGSQPGAGAYSQGGGAQSTQPGAYSQGGPAAPRSEPIYHQ